MYKETQTIVPHATYKKTKNECINNHVTKIKLLTGGGWRRNSGVAEPEGKTCSVVILIHMCHMCKCMIDGGGHWGMGGVAMKIKNTFERCCSITIFMNH